MNTEKTYIIKCTQEEMSTILNWASDGIYDYMGTDGFINDGAAEADKILDKIIKQIDEQDRVDESQQRTLQIGVEMFRANEIKQRVKTPGVWSICSDGFVEFRPYDAPGIVSYRFAQKDDPQKYFVTQTIDDGTTEIFPDVDFEKLVYELNHPEI